MNRRSFNWLLIGVVGLVVVVFLQRPHHPTKSAEAGLRPSPEPAEGGDGLRMHDQLDFSGSPAKPEVSPRSRAGLSHESILDEPNSEVALRWILLLPEGDRQRDLARAVLTRVAETNALEAAQLAVSLPASLARPTVAAVVSLWGSRDAAAAAAWVRSLPDALLRQESVISLSAAWAAAEPLQAAEYAIASMTGEAQSRMLNLAGAQWAGKDAASAVAWAEQLPPGDARDQFLSGASGTVAEASPAEGARLVVSMNPGPAQEDAALTVVIEWARLDPQAAADWVKTFPSGSLRDKALRETISVLQDQDRGAAQKILAEWPRGSELDQAIHHFLTQIQNSDPAAGAEALKTINDPALLQEDTERLAQHWLMENPINAREWLAGQALPDEMKQRLLAHPAAPAF